MGHPGALITAYKRNSTLEAVLEFRIFSLETATKSNFEKANRVWNQASRIMTRALRSTPIQAMDTMTGLQTLESRQDTKILTQTAKFKRP